MDPISLNVAGVQSLVGSKLNKVNSGATNELEGLESEKIDELTLSLSDEELLQLKQKWESRYAGYEAKLKARQDANKAYYLGRQKEGSQWVTTDGQPISANLLFEAEETFLPAALAKNPEPVVWADNTEEGNKLSDDVKSMLQYHADTLVLRRKLTLMTRHWSIYFIGIAKHGWDEKIQEITTEVRDPRNFVFDPEGYIDVYGDYIGPLGERITVTASRLIELFPKHKGYITLMVDGKLGTNVTYTEWWNDDYCFYTFKDMVLDKSKNPYFNYEKTEQTIGLDGMPQEVKVPGKNHFAIPKKPYTFLSVFSLGEQPHDETSLIEQNIPNQRRVSRRTEQIDYNLSRANNSTVFSENNFTQETAKQASTGMAKGHPILVPSGGPITEAIHQIPAQGIDASYFKELENSKEDLRTIFGTQGITPTEDKKSETARGMILQNQYDSSRIGGGIGDALEQVADNIFNWWVQLYHIHYDVPHVASILGQMKAVEYVQLSAQSLDRRLVISVSPNSMKPKDEISEMNEAMQLFEAGVLDPKTLLTRLNFPDPQTTAEQSVLWMIDKNAYMQLNFPQLAQQLAQVQQQAMAQQNALQQQQVQQGMQQQEAQVGQQLSHKEAQHQQKMAHTEQSFKQKQEQNISKGTANPSIKQVKLPK